jgi:ketosteroid isomerase-like protein
MDRRRIEATLTAIYAARAANDAAGILAHFAQGAAYRIAGDSACCGMAQEYRGEALPAALGAMCALFQVQALDPGPPIIDGPRAAVPVRARFTFAPTGETVDTAMVDLWTFANGKVAAVEEYLDTAHLARLQSATT